MDPYSCVSPNRGNIAFDFSNPGIPSSSAFIYGVLNLCKSFFLCPVSIDLLLNTYKAILFVFFLLDLPVHLY